MAKWGEGDPRWIVEERADATNVNNWHWTEKNCTPWSKDRLKELLAKQVLLEEGLGKVETTDSVTVTGEASASNRKGKLIFFYELNVKFNWKGTTPGGDTAEGSVEIPNLSEEFDLDEIEIQVSINKENNISRDFKELMRKKGVEVVRAKIGQYLTDLKKEYSKDLIKPTPKAGAVADDAKARAMSPAAVSDQGLLQKTSHGVQIVNGANGPAFPTSIIEDSLEFKCSAEDAYLVLTDPSRIQAWSQSQIKFDTRPGGDWSLFGGNVRGQFVELVPGKKIVMTFREASWPAGHFSNVTFEFTQGESSTVVSLKQTGVPATEVERTTAGWKTNYWRRINSVFGYGAHFGEF
eukprot:comp12283_c1_seq1/m.7108 comp12283_c1_seq1/g.7108  ORF comp12283_c1_seq1/g.7108 comp12283_c1_seq1/m.7108 type:complete len:350 (-) comp12283_c1_seq1:72-1121(-)